MKNVPKDAQQAEFNKVLECTSKPSEPIAGRGQGSQKEPRGASAADQPKPSDAAGFFDQLD